MPNLFPLIDSTIMTADQELLFQRKANEKTSRYFWTAIIFILLFQIYNITYALIYTNFRLDTRASRIYMALYVSMFLICACCAAAGFAWKFSRKETSTQFLRLYTVFSFLLLFWSVCITLYDQRISSNMSIYLTCAIYLAGLIYLTPRISIPMFLSCEAVLLTGLVWLHLKEAKDTYGICVNSVGVTLVALFISLYRWSSMRRDFLNQMEIEEKNRMILEQSEKLNYMANHDALTGLWNRNYLNQWKEGVFTSINAFETAVFIIDIDYFKQYNDAFGHVAGDECLRQVARVLQKTGDIIFRFGGEEFLCVLVDARDVPARNLAENLCQKVEEQQIPAAKPGTFLTVSVGYSMGKITNDTEFRQLLHEADSALYSAKHNGRNQAVKYPGSRS